MGEDCSAFFLATYLVVNVLSLLGVRREKSEGDEVNLVLVTSADRLLPTKKATSSYLERSQSLFSNRLIMSVPNDW